jgi:hypothetical protein
MSEAASTSARATVNGPGGGVTDAGWGARLFPPSTNRDYTGSMASAYILTVFGVLSILPGSIHTFAPDGGAGTIAGIDLSHNGGVIIALFAWAGATQIALGVVSLIVSLRYRTLVPLLLSAAVLERGLHAFCFWILKSAGTGHHPPEHYGVLVGLPILIIALAGSLRDRTGFTRRRGGAEQ